MNSNERQSRASVLSIYYDPFMWVLRTWLDRILGRLVARALDRAKADVRAAIAWNRRPKRTSAMLIAIAWFTVLRQPNPNVSHLIDLSRLQWDIAAAATPAPKSRLG